MSKCYDCGLEYINEGWIEAIIPDDIWNDISPTGDSGGLLCITCMSKRLVYNGYTTATVPVELAGIEPLRNITDTERYNRLEQKYGELVDKYDKLLDDFHLWLIKYETLLKEKRDGN